MKHQKKENGAEHLKKSAKYFPGNNSDISMDRNSGKREFHEKHQKKENGAESLKKYKNISREIIQTLI